jgi:hypothetical protein
MLRIFFIQFFVYFIIKCEILCSQNKGESLSTEICENQIPDFDGDRCCLYKAYENDDFVTQCISINEKEIKSTIKKWEGQKNFENGILYKSISIECYVEPDSENIKFIKYKMFILLIINLLFLY